MAQPISLTITDAGRSALLDFLRHCSPGSIIALSLSGVEGQCDVGAFDKEKIPPSEVLSISGMQFVFKDNESRRLNGKTLDYRGGMFRVN
jgi:hypothetical protein